MAIDWGSYEGHLRCGIDHTVSPANPSHSDTNVDVTWKFYVDSDGWNFDDPETLHESADGWGGTSTSFHNGSSGGAILVDTHKETYSINYSNSGSKSASCNLSGAFNGATPSKTSSVNLPERPIAAPSAGEAPSASAITADGATISWDVPDDNGGDSVDNYEVQISTGSGFSSPTVDHTMGSASRTYTTTALNSNTGYYARVRAHNSAGWGDWTGSTFLHFTTLAGLPGTPGTPTKTSGTQTSLTIGWTAAASNGGGTITYTLDRALDSAFTVGLTTITTTSTSYTSTGLVANTTYYYRLKATNTLGTSGETPTLTAKTNTLLLYNDSGDYVTLVNNLASAVADKLVRLGSHIWVAKTTALTIPNGADTPFNMNTVLQTRGPGAPTHGGTGTTDITIQYPGVYDIEFAFRFDESTDGRGSLYIYVNGENLPATTNLKAGIAEGFRMMTTTVAGGALVPLRKTRVTVPLSIGDTVGWGVYQKTGGSMVQAPPGGNSDLYAWGKVTMVGL